MTVNLLKSLINFPSRIVILLIRVYQITLSPDHGWLLRGKYPYGFCRYYPSCSEYAKAAVDRNGVIKGVMQAAYRVVRCNPWAEPKIEINN